MSVPMHMPPTKHASSRVILHTVGPIARLKDACTALASLGFTIVPAAAAVSHLLGPPQAGQALAGARGKEGFSQRQLAALTGIPQRHISEMEHGKRPIGKAHAKLLAKTLKVDYRVLL